MHGKLFLSARIVGFYANLFGHRTSFFFLWEDIEAVQVLPPTLASVGSPTLVLVLRKGRGLDARHGANLKMKKADSNFISNHLYHSMLLAGSSVMKCFTKAFS